MKTNYTLVVFLLFSFSLSAQILGNYKRKNSIQNFEANQIQSNEFGPSAQYRSVAKAANIVGNNILDISINALSNQKADTYTAIFNVTQLGATAEQTNSALANRIDPFINELKSIGIADDAIYVDIVNFLPKYEFDVSKKLFSKKSYKEIPIGFELQKNVHIRFTDPSMMDQMITAAAKQEIYDIVKVDYFVANPEEKYSELRQATMVYLEKIKNQYKSVGIELDSAYLITGENAWVAYPGDRYESYKAYSGQSLSAQQRVDAKVDKIDKPISRFYDAVPANDYDIVINPEILEPSVQFSYNLLVRFTLPERIPQRRVERQKEYVLVTPDGEVKTLEVVKKE